MFVLVAFLDMNLFHRRIAVYSREFRRYLIAERIPQYKERSALLPSDVHSPFPVVVEPDIDLESLFRSHEQLQDNLQRRHWIVDVKKVEHDYQLWKKLNRQLSEATARRSSVGESFPFFSILANSSRKNCINGLNNCIHSMRNFSSLVYDYLLHYMQLFLKQVHENYCMNMVLNENLV